MSTPTYDGNAIFGWSATVTMEPEPSEAQYATFFGLDGVYRLHGGTRGRMFFCTGVLHGTTVSDLNAAEQLITNLDDGVAATLVDSRGRTWEQAVYNGDFKPASKLGFARGQVVMAYKCTFKGLV